MWSWIVQMGVRFLGLALDRVQADAEAKQRFLSFIEALETRQLASKEYRESYQRQLERLNNSQKNSSP